MQALVVEQDEMTMGNVTRITVTTFMAPMPVLIQVRRMPQ